MEHFKYGGLRESNRIFCGEIRVREDFVVEKKITIIQHKKVGEKEIGMTSIWEPILIDGREVEIQRSPQTETIHSLGFPDFRSVVYKEEFFCDDLGFLSTFANIFCGSEIIRSRILLLINSRSVAVNKV